MRKNRHSSEDRHQEVKKQRRKQKRADRKKKMQSLIANKKNQDTMFEESQPSARFTSMSLQYVLTEADLFSEEQPFDVHQALANISREDVINCIFTLNTQYRNADVELLPRLFSRENQAFADQLNNRIDSFRHKYHDNSFDDILFTTDQTSLEILRMSFSMPDIGTTSLSKAEIEKAMIRIILSANSKVIDITQGKPEDIEATLFINNASNKFLLDISDSEIQNQMSSQMIMGIRFFKFISSNVKYRELYEAFLSKYGIKRWQEYFRTLAVLCFKCKGITAKYDKVFSWDINHIITQSVVSQLCLSYDAYLKYQADNEGDTEGNSDYRYFRAKPLIRMRNGDYVVINKNFLVDKFYNSLYFDFKKITNQLHIKEGENVFPSDFIEKTVFDSLIKQCASEDRYRSLSEKKSKENHHALENELGPPDYVLISDKSIILFECKDIHINGWILEQRDYDRLTIELKNKLLRKKKSNGSPINRKDGRPIGIGQLAKGVTNIVRGEFNYSQDIGSQMIYSVLILSDRRINYDGFNQIANRWFKEELGNLLSDRIRPAIIISLDTITRYKHLFNRDGFEKYFEEYILASDTECDSMVAVANRTMSFDSYMQNYTFDLSKEAEEVIHELRRK